MRVAWPDGHTTSIGVELCIVGRYLIDWRHSGSRVQDAALPATGHHIATAVDHDAARTVRDIDGSRGRRGPLLSMVRRSFSFHGRTDSRRDSAGASRLSGSHLFLLV